MKPYDRIRALQQALRVSRGRKPKVDDLVVLSRGNDPFYSGSDGQIANAEWFAELWEQFGYTSGVHLRRIHYRILSEGNIRRPDGSLYENNSACWQWMQAASRHARYLGLIDPEDIIDKRNLTPHIHLEPRLFGEPQWSYEMERYRLDRLYPDLGNEWRTLVSIETEVNGYHYAHALQPYHVEVWAEKTTMDDILVPLCRERGTNYVSGAGYQSITSMIGLLRERVHQLQKPTRVLYVSDYDDAGQNMPHQMARQMEFWIAKYATEYDIRVEPIVMTAEQAVDYPGAPDTGAVELDAMEAIDPGRLERIVSEAVAQFRDPRLSRKVRALGIEAASAVREAVDATIADEIAAVEEVKADAEEIYERYQAELDELAARLDADLAPLDERLETVQHAIAQKLEALEVDLPALPEPDVDPDDEDWLFDSRRDYLEQLAHYKRRKLEVLKE